MNGRAYYNENDRFAAGWLRELILAGHIRDGDVDERDIRLVRPDDVRGYIAYHFFAGIGGWPYALDLAGWPSDRPVWTGSCPCQPLSSAGRRKGDLDERHLWPAFYDLIAECKPPIVFGEQVASKDGREWFAAVRIDLEKLGYACGAADLCAAGVGAPHIRQRLFWVADAQEQPPRSARDSGSTKEARGWRPNSVGCSSFDGMADGLGARLEGRDARALGYERETTERGGEAGVLGDADGLRSAWIGGCRQERTSEPSPWCDLEWLLCRDGKARPAKPGIQPLAYGVPNRVGTLRGAGNAIVPQVAAEFVRACL